MMAGGVTSVELKSGYGLNLEGELKMLRIACDIAHGMMAVPTYLGAHAFPPEKGRKEYVREIVKEQLPEVKRLSLSSYCDIFIEKGAFNIREARSILCAAKELGFRITAHIDEFSNTGGAVLAAELAAVSVSHLAFTPRSDFALLAEAGTIGIILPSTPLFSMGNRYPDAGSMISEGMAVAVGTDLSPNSWNESLMLSCLLSVYRCGLKQEEAITAATLNSACAIGLGGIAGSLEPGKRADFVCFDFDDYRKIFYRYAANQVKSVYSGGREAVLNTTSFS
jgi:imidazolonepropionase